MRQKKSHIVAQYEKSYSERAKNWDTEKLGDGLILVEGTDAHKARFRAGHAIAGDDVDRILMAKN